MRLKDFMSRGVKTIRAGQSLEAAYQEMKLQKIRHLVVIEGKAVAGILSERDLKGMNPRDRKAQRVADVMHEHVVTANPEMTVREAANLMRGQIIGCLPVLEKDRLVGIITVTDLLNLIGQGIERITPDVSRRPVVRETPNRARREFNRKVLFKKKR